MLPDSMTAVPSESPSVSSTGARNGLVARAVRWAFKDGWRLGLFIFGLLIFGLGLAILIYHGYIHNNDFGYSSLETLMGGDLFGVTSRSGWRQYDLFFYVVWQATGLLVATVGYFLWRRRFSLRSLLIAVLLIASTLAVPSVVPPGGRSPYVAVRLDLADFGLTPAMRVELGEWLRAYLAPQALNDALPEQVRFAVDLKAERPFRLTKAYDVSDEPDVYCLLTETDPHLTSKQLATLGEFHVTYVHAILADFYAAKKMPFTDRTAVPALGGRWGDFRDNWLKVHAAAPFVAPPRQP